MANPWKWYIVVMCGEDYYILLQGCYIVWARSVEEAKRKALVLTGFTHYWASDVFGPFHNKPKRAI